jgi:hypothetical protein
MEGIITRKTSQKLPLERNHTSAGGDEARVSTLLFFFYFGDARPMDHAPLSILVATESCPNRELARGTRRSSVIKNGTAVGFHVERQLMFFFCVAKRRLHSAGGVAERQGVNHNCAV